MCILLDRYILYCFPLPKRIPKFCSEIPFVELKGKHVFQSWVNKNEQYCYFWRNKVLYADFQCEKTVDVKKSKSCEAEVSSDLRKEIENHYKLSLPEDFYHFWKFCEELDPENPAGELLQNHSPASTSGKDSRKLHQGSKFTEKELSQTCF